MAQSTISQRIALEGAEDVLRQLSELGQAGEKAIQQITDATSGMGAGLSGLSGFSALAQSEFGKVSAALEPVKANFLALEEAAKGVGERIVSVASILGVGLVGGLAGGIAGFVELIKSSAEAGHQLEVQAGTLGLTVEQLQAYRKVAAEAGVDGDRVFTALTKLTQNLGKETEKLTADTIKAFAALPAAMSAAGAGVLRGSAQPETGTNRGIAGISPEAIASVNEFTQQFAKAAEAQGKVLSVADLERYRQSVIKLAGDVSDVGEKFRLAAAAAGVPFPALTQGEELKRNAETAADPVLRLRVTLQDLQNAGDNLDPVIRKILDGLAGISDPAQKNQIALALLGRSAKELTEAFSGGSGSLDDALAKIKATGIGLSPEQAALLSEAEKDFVRLGGAAAGLRNQLAVIFAPALIDVTKTFTDLIKNNVDTFKDWARVIASDVLPGIANLIQQFTGAGQAAKGVMPAAPGEPTSAGGAVETSGVDSVRDKLITLRETAIAVGTAISSVFTTLRSVLTSVAAAINAVFGTMLTASGLAAVLVVGTLSGAFSLLLPVIGLVAAAIGVLATPIGLAVAAIGLIVLAIVNWRTSLAAIQGALAAVAQGLSSNFSGALTAVSSVIGAISTGIQTLVVGLVPIITPVFTAITAALNGAVSAVAATLSGVAGTISGAFTSAIDVVEQAFNGFVNFVSGIATSIVGALQPVLDFIGNIAGGLAGLVSGAGAAASSAGAGGLGLDSSAALQASGGMAGAGPFGRGPAGTDTIPAYLTPGEFVVRAQAVGHYGSALLHAINNMHFSPFDLLRGLQGFSLGGMVGSAMDAFAPSPSPLMLAAGGLALGGGGVSGGPMNSLTLNLSGQSFQLDVAPGHVFDKLARHARTAAVNSAGRKPSWYASR